MGVGGGGGNASTLLNDLVAHWRLDEASGTRVDVHGGNDLTDNNTVTQAAGRLGNAAQFTAANSEYLNISDNAVLSMGDIDFTIAAWVYLGVGFSDRVILGKWGLGGSGEYMVRYQTSSDQFQFFVNSDGSSPASITASTFGAVPDATWLFVVAWHDAGANTINISVNDGAADSAAHSAGVFDGAYGFVLGSQGGGADFWDGRIDSVSIWKRVLTAGERTSLYNSGAGLDYPF